MLGINQIAEGYRFCRTQLDFLDIVRDKFNPSKILHNPIVKAKFDDYLDGETSPKRRTFRLGEFFYCVAHPGRLFAGCYVEINNLLIKIHYERIKELERLTDSI